MQTYKEYQPTSYDRKGAFLRDQGDWLVVPVGLNRDSDTLSESNFETAIDMLGGESDTVERHRFGHWACGWFEIIIVEPSSPQADIARDIEARLEHYPVLDESDWSEREYDAACETWLNQDLRFRIKACAKYDVSIFAARRDDIPESPTGELISYLADGR